MPLKADIKTVEKHADSKSEEVMSFSDVLARSEELIGRAATTKLEFQMITAMTSMSNGKASAAIKSLEREYGTAYRLVRGNWVHPALLKWRNSIVNSQDA